MSVIVAWNRYIDYLKEASAKGVEPLGFDDWAEKESDVRCYRS